MDGTQGRVCRKCLIRDMSAADYEEKLGKYIEAISPAERADEKTREERLTRCLECEKLLEGTCLACGCYVEIRASLRDGHCPKKRW